MAGLLLVRFQPVVFGLDQFVEDVLVQHAGFAEGRGRERIDDGIVDFEAAFGMLDHAPFRQLLVADHFGEMLESTAQALKLRSVRKFALHGAQAADAGGLSRTRRVRAAVCRLFNQRHLINAERLLQPLSIEPVPRLPTLMSIRVDPPDPESTIAPAKGPFTKSRRSTSPYLRK